MKTILSATCLAKPLRRSKRKVLLCDGAKYNHMSLIRIADLDHIDLLISDAPPPSNIAAALAKANVEIEIAPSLPGA